MTWSNRNLIRAGLALCLFLFGALAAWGLGTTLAGAVIARGQIRPAGISQPVEVLEAARLAEVSVREGDRVAAGAVVARLDDRALRADRAALICEITALDARIDRLDAEANGETSYEPPKASPTDCGNPGQSEATVFAAALARFQAEQTLISGQIAQAERQLQGTQARIRALDDEIGVVADEYDRMGALVAKGLAPESALAALGQQVTALAGRRGELETAAALADGQIRILTDQAESLAAARRDDAARNLAETDAAHRRLKAELSAIEQRLATMSLTAPIDGLVHLLGPTAPGTIVRPGQPILSLVPTATPMAELYVTPAEIGAISLGQSAVLRLMTVEAATTPELTGIVSEIGTDLMPLGDAAAYRVLITISGEDLARIGPVPPGTPVEAFIATEARTPFSYLARPFTDYFTRALRD